MAEEVKKTTTKKTTTRKPRSNLVGATAKPTPASELTKLDIDTNKHFIDAIIGSGIAGGLDVGELEQFTQISNNRNEIYSLIDTMANDSSVSSIIRTYAEDVCEMSDNGHIMWCESSDPKISKFVNYLLNVMNVDKNIYSWAYCLVKYGDVYLRLFRESDYEDPLFNTNTVKDTYSARNVLNEDYKESVMLNLHATHDPYSHYVEMVPDPSTMYELTRMGMTYGFIETPNTDFGFFDYTNTVSGNTTAQLANYRMKSNDVNVYQADDFVHACLDDNFTRYPEKVELFRTDGDYKAGINSTAYSVKRGKSLLYDAYKIWREKSLVENAILLTRMTRSSLYRKVGVEVGDMSKEQAQLALRRVKEMFEQRSALSQGQSMSEYNNPGPIENNIYFATHNGQGNITIEAVGGDVNIKDLTDLDNLTNKFYASFGIPKQYFGWTEDGAGFNGGTSLTILSSVYAKGVKRVQNALIQAVTDAVNLFLLNKGCRSYLNNFVLKMRSPLTQEEISYRENLSNRVTAISNIQGLFSDVENKVNKLNILKSLVRTLDYGDDLITVIDDEIKKTEELLREEAEKKAKEEAEAAAAGTEPADSMEEAPTESASNEDDDLGLSDIAPIESFTASGSTPLVEEADVIVEDADNYLPLPEELDANIDFSENK